MEFLFSYSNDNELFYFYFLFAQASNLAELSTKEATSKVKFIAVGKVWEN